MSTNSPDTKWAHPKPTEIGENEEEEEEEALSLCDLPINNQHNHQPTKEEEEVENTQQFKPEVDDFDFKSWGPGSGLTTHPQMCAADDVFFQGQIIPLRHSISSTEGGCCLPAAFSGTPSRGCISRSESMDRFHSMITGFSTSVTNSSRSSSVRSSLRSSSSGSSTTTTTTNHQKHNKVLNQFHSHPSPSPQIRIPSSRYSNTVNRVVPKSNLWSFFRVGLVHTPEIELQGLKNRNGSRNGNKSNGFGSRNSNSSSSSSSSEKNRKIKQKLFFGGNNGGGFFSGGGCKCSVDAVETVPLRVVFVKEEEDGGEKEKGKQKQKKEKEKKQKTVSHHRTFEWLKELSNAGVPD